MIVSPPEFSKTDGQCVVTARLRGESRVPLGCDELRYSVPEEFGSLLTTRVDGFAVVALVLAMRNGERLDLRGGVSGRLLRGMKLYQAQLCEWYPTVFSPVVITANEVVEQLEEPRATLCVSAFSGGLDSCYTVVAEGGRRNSRGGALDMVLFAKFFDNPRADAAYPVAVGEYREKLEQIGIGLLPIVTNAQQVAEPVSWDIAHGAALISCALVLGAGIGRFYIPGSGQFTAWGEIPSGLSTAWGSHVDLDPLLGTETMDVVHHAVEVYRSQKLERIGGSDVACSLLHVCLRNPEGEDNCGECKKCHILLSIATLYGIDGRLARFPRPRKSYLLENAPGPMVSWPATPIQLMDVGLHSGRWRLVWHGFRGAVHHGVVMWWDRGVRYWKEWRVLRHAVRLLGVNAETGFPDGTVFHDVEVESDGGWLLVVPTSRDPHVTLPSILVEDGRDLWLCVEIENAGMARFEVFHTLNGEGFAAERSVSKELDQGVERFTLRMEVGAGRVSLRIDPSDQLTHSRIRYLTIFNVNSVNAS